jgi:hypothetical protein
VFADGGVVVLNLPAYVTDARISCAVVVRRLGEGATGNLGLVADALCAKSG